MPYFKDTENKLHFLDDASFAYLLPTGSVQITDEEYAELTAPPPETAEEITARLEKALDVYIDEQAQSYRYESIRTMVTYIGDPNAQFNAEGQGALNFRSACYTLALIIIGEVQQGRPVPTEAELIAEMPTLASFIN